jgi:hypothetical protein
MTMKISGYKLGIFSLAVLLSACSSAPNANSAIKPQGLYSGSCQRSVTTLCYLRIEGGDVFYAGVSSGNSGDTFTTGELTDTTFSFTGEAAQLEGTLNGNSLSGTRTHLDEVAEAFEMTLMPDAELWSVTATGGSFLLGLSLAETTLAGNGRGAVTGIQAPVFGTAEGTLTDESGISFGLVASVLGTATFTGTLNAERDAMSGSFSAADVTGTFEAFKLP